MGTTEMETPQGHHFISHVFREILPPCAVVSTPPINVEVTDYVSMAQIYGEKAVLIQPGQAQVASSCVLTGRVGVTAFS
jgi:hypothetical protein